MLNLARGKERGGRDALRIATDKRRGHEPNSARPEGVAEGDDVDSDWSEAALRPPEENEVTVKRNVVYICRSGV